MRMKIVVMGSGGIGGYFGGRLAAAGHDVTFIARGAHLAALQSDGLRIESPLGNAHLTPARATSALGEVVAPDVVIFAVKMGDAAAAAAALKPIVGKATSVFAFQNGVEAADVIGQSVGAAAVVPGVARIAAHIVRPGVIEHGSPFASLEFGESDKRSSERCAAFLEACKRAVGIQAQVSPDIQRALWLKFALLAPMSGITTLTQHRAGALRSNPDTRALIEAAIDEVIAVGAAVGGHLTPSDRETILKSIDAMPEVMTTSMSHDRAAGKPLELPWLSGSVVRLGEKHGVPTPTHRFVTRALALEIAGKKS
jgi:2-dehydropantoate 2-reductase